MGPAPREIESRRFGLALWGYDREEVAEYLRAIATEQQRLLDLIEQHQQQAAEEADRIRAEAQLHAQERLDLILSGAQSRVDSLAAAEGRIRRRLNEARRELAAALDALDPTEPRRSGGHVYELDLTTTSESLQADPSARAGSPIWFDELAEDPFERMVRDALGRAVRQVRSNVTPD